MVLPQVHWQPDMGRAALAHQLQFRGPFLDNMFYRMRGLVLGQEEIDAIRGQMDGGRLHDVGEQVVCFEQEFASISACAMA